MNLKKYYLFVTIFIIIIVIPSLAYAYGGDSAPGFFPGLWDGSVWIGHLIEKIYSDQYVYQDYNNGFLYNLGFFGALLTVSWNVALLLSGTIILWDLLIFTLGVFSIHKKEIVGFVYFCIAFSMFAYVWDFLSNIFPKLKFQSTNDNNPVEQNDKANIPNSSNPDLHENNLNFSSSIDKLCLFQKDGTIFFNGEFFIVKSSKTKVGLVRVRQISISSDSHLIVVFRKLEGGEAQLLFPLTDIREDSLDDLAELIKLFNISINNLSTSTPEKDDHHTINEDIQHLSEKRNNNQKKSFIVPFGVMVLIIATAVILINIFSNTKNPDSNTLETYSPKINDQVTEPSKTIKHKVKYFATAFNKQGSMTIKCVEKNEGFLKEHEDLNDSNIEFYNKSFIDDNEVRYIVTHNDHVYIYNEFEFCTQDYDRIKAENTRKSNKKRQSSNK